MPIEMIIVFIVLLIAIILFIFDFWRYDIVAIMALLFITVIGIIPFEQTFIGFSHSAIITVIAVLIISKGLINSGLVDEISKKLSKVSNNTILQIFILLMAVSILSAFMNNVGALALLMPVAIRFARKAGKSPSIFLMPLAFGSHFGGWITLIGTPSNLIVSSFRVRNGVGPFNMFDFSLIGIGISLACIIFIALGGWRLIPKRERRDPEGALTQINKYLTEVHITEKSKLVGKRLYDITNITSADVIIINLIRDRTMHPAPSNLRVLQEGDILIIEGNHEDLKLFINDTKLELSEDRTFKEGIFGSDEVSVMEVVIGPTSIMNRQTVKSLNLYNTYGINLLAIAHHEERLITRLNRIKLKIGDVLLIQGHKETLDATLSDLGCLPLAERSINLGKPRQIFLSIIIFGTALAISALNILPVHIAFSIAALTMILFKVISLEEAYKSINWPIIILLGAMIPVGLALEITGGSRFIASILLESGIIVSPLIALILILIITMFLSDIINNVAAVIIIAPIAINLAMTFGVSIDPFLIAVLIGGSSAFLTPIGHQSNVLVMGPGGYKFGDYWRLGLIIEVIIIVVGIPLILLFFPF